MIKIKFPTKKQLRKIGKILYTCIGMIICVFSVIVGTKIYNGEIVFSQEFYGFLIFVTFGITSFIWYRDNAEMLFGDEPNEQKTN